MGGFWQSWPLRVNHTDNKTAEKTAAEAAADRKGYETYLITAMMFAYPVLVAMALTSNNAAAAAATSGLAYMLSIYLHYGVARLAFLGRNYLLWTGAVAAFVVGFSLTGLSALWPLLTAWSLILFAGAVVGRLSAAGRNQVRVYLMGLSAATFFALVNFLPQVGQQMAAMSDMTEKFVQDLNKGLIALGYGADAVHRNLEDVEKMFHVLVRLVPAMLVLSAVVPFSVGYLFFAYRLDRKKYPGRTLAPFARWKMPFAVIGVIIVIIPVRLLGGETLTLVADNVLAFLGFYYLVTGLALIEFYLKRFLPTFLRVAFYVAFFFTQFAGVYIAAIMLSAVILLGFVDSFLDWRKVQQLSLETK